MTKIYENLPFQDIQPSYEGRRMTLESSGADISQQGVQMLGLVRSDHPLHLGADNLHLS